METEKAPRPVTRTPRERAAGAAVSSLLRAADRAGRALEEFFLPYGVTGQQYNVLRILRGAGTPLPTMAVAERMMQKTPGLTGILDRLERKGLLRRERSDNDRRVWLCSITDPGQELLRRIDRPLSGANVRAIGGLTTTELAELVSLLDRVHPEPAAQA